MEEITKKFKEEVEPFLELLYRDVENDIVEVVTIAVSYRDGDSTEQEFNINSIKYNTLTGELREGI